MWRDVRTKVGKGEMIAQTQTMHAGDCGGSESGKKNDYQWDVHHPYI